ncbi:MAG: hypothetical protein ACREMA_10230, partial [Longimicrobiales bacterium]
MAVNPVELDEQARVSGEAAQPTTSTGALDRSFVHSLAWTGAAKWMGQIVAWGRTIVVARFLV